MAQKKVFPKLNLIAYSSNSIPKIKKLEGTSGTFSKQIKILAITN